MNKYLDLRLGDFDLDLDLERDNDLLRRGDRDRERDRDLERGQENNYYSWYYGTCDRNVFLDG